MDFILFHCDRLKSAFVDRISTDWSNWPNQWLIQWTGPWPILITDSSFHSRTVYKSVSIATVHSHSDSLPIDIKESAETESMLWFSLESSCFVWDCACASLFLLLPVLFGSSGAHCIVCFYFGTGPLFCIARFLVVLIHSLYADNLNVYKRFLLMCCGTKSFSIKCVLNYYWSHFDAHYDWIVIFPLYCVERFLLSLALCDARFLSIH